jgi:hypothetical protein
MRFKRMHRRFQLHDVCMATLPAGGIVLSGGTSSSNGRHFRNASIRGEQGWPYRCPKMASI